MSVWYTTVQTTLYAIKSSIYTCQAEKQAWTTRLRTVVTLTGCSSQFHAIVSTGRDLWRLVNSWLNCVDRSGLDSTWHFNFWALLMVVWLGTLLFLVRLSIFAGWWEGISLTVADESSELLGRQWWPFQTPDPECWKSVLNKRCCWERSRYTDSSSF